MDGQSCDGTVLAGIRPSRDLRRVVGGAPFDHRCDEVRLDADKPDALRARELGIEGVRDARQADRDVDVSGLELTLGFGIVEIDDVAARAADRFFAEPGERQQLAKEKRGREADEARRDPQTAREEGRLIPFAATPRLAMM